MNRRHAGLLLLALAAAAATVVALRARRGPPPGAERLAALTRERDALQDELRHLVIGSGERSLADAPASDVMIGLPTSLTRSIVEQVVTGVFGQTTLTLEGVRVRKEGDVKARLLVSRRVLGEYLVEVKIHRVQGLLQAGAPALEFGENAVDVTLPVRLAGGEGTADLRFRWVSRGVADVFCDDFDVTRTITGSVVPEDYDLAGRFAIAADGESIVLRPSFPDLKARIAVRPSEEAWRVVDAVIRDRPKGCEIALGAIDVKERLAGMLGRGFDVRIPQKIFKPVRLPAGVRQSVRAHGIDLELEVKPAGVIVASDRLWYGADVSVRPIRRR